MLTPLAVDPGHPFPYISTLSLSIAVGLRDPETGEKRFARVKIPPILPRLFAVERDKFVLLDQVIEANLDELFRGMEILETHLFRVTRDADIAIEEDEADDLLLAIEEEIRRRRFGEAVRLEVERSMPELTRQILIKGTGVRDEDAFEVAGMLDLTALWQLVSLDRPDLKAPVHTPGHPPAAPAAGRGRAGRRLRADARGRHLRPPPVRVVHGVGGAVHRPGRRRPRGPHDQADPVPDVGPVADRRRAHPRRGARQAGRGPGRDQGPLRRGEQHRLGPPPRAGRRPRRVRPRRPQDALQGGARRPARGQRPAPLRPHRHRATTTARPPACTRTSGC